MITVYVFGSKPKVEKKHPVEDNPLVRFFYPCKEGNSTLRTVRLIGADEKYLIGLDCGDKNRFKKFLRSKANYFTLVEFNPSAV